MGCAGGYESHMTCNSFEQSYKCFGGLVHHEPVTKEICYECAKSCSGCFTMRIAYGFIDRDAVQHLLDQGIK